MLTWFNTTLCYRFIKSGLLMDFIFKKSVLLWLKLQFFFYNMFVEKYYVEFLFLRVKDYSAACVRIIDLYAREFAFSALAGFLIIVFILILCF